MYQIAKQHLKHSKDLSPVTIFMFNIDCEQNELVSVLSKLRALAKAENLKYKLTGYAGSTRFIVTEVKALDIESIVDSVNKLIINTIGTYNDAIKAHNVIVKRANKANSKHPSTNIKGEAKVTDYTLTFAKEGEEYAIDVVNGAIIVEEV